MKNLSREERLLVEFVNLREVRDDSLDLERRLFSLVVAARRCKVDSMFRKSLQGVLLCLRASIALMNGELYSGRFSGVRSSCSDSVSDELPF